MGEGAASPDVSRDQTESAGPSGGSTQPTPDAQVEGGRRQQFEALYREWHDVVWSAARPLLPCDADADGVAQRVFLRILRNGVMRPARGWTEAYFRVAGRNEASKRFRGGTDLIPLSDAAAAQVPAADILPDRMLHLRQVRALLRSLIATLPPRCAAVMTLRLEGASNRAIAKKLGITVKAVEKQGARGRTLLDGMLQERGYGGLSSILDGGGAAFDGFYGRAGGCTSTFKEVGVTWRIRTGYKRWWPFLLLMAAPLELM
jgi:RNA polymerase sigma factor (sigma-70 family)